MRHEPENEFDKIVREEKLEEIARDCRDAMVAVHRLAAPLPCGTMIRGEAPQPDERARA